MCILEFVAWSLMSIPKRNKFLKHSHSAKKVLATYRKTSYLYRIFSRRSSTPHARTKIAKIRCAPPPPPPPPPPVCNRTHLAWPPFMRTYYLFTLSPFRFRHSQFLGYFHFYLYLRLNFTKSVSKRFLWFLFIELSTIRQHKKV